MQTRSSSRTFLLYLLVGLGTINVLRIASDVTSGKLASMDPDYATGTVVGSFVWIIIGSYALWQLLRTQQTTGIATSDPRPYVAGVPQQQPAPSCSATAPRQPWTPQPQAYAPPHGFTPQQPQSYPAPEHRPGSVPPPGL